MADVQYDWETEITKWWPSRHPESGEPDIPHDTYLSRELPLYVDFSYVGQGWYQPSHELEKDRFDRGAELDECKKSLSLLERTFQAGLYGAECLLEFHDSFKRYYLTENTGTDELARIYEDVKKRIESKFGIPKKVFEDSALQEWPLYHFVSQRF